MEAVTLALLGNALDAISAPVLEVGCGDGGMLATVRAQQPDQLALGVDLDPPASPFPFDFAQADGQRLPYSENTFGALLALDVFDQQGVQLAAALAEAHRVLTWGGMLLLRVSAHERLFGPHDRAFGTGRRYGRAELLRAVTAAGLTIERSTFTNTLLAPLLIPQRLLQRHGIVQWQPSIYEAGWSNRLVATLLAVEAKWLRRRDLPFGLSLVVLARK